VAGSGRGRSRGLWECAAVSLRREWCRRRLPGSRRAHCRWSACGPRCRPRARSTCSVSRMMKLLTGRDTRTQNLETRGTIVRAGGSVMRRSPSGHACSIATSTMAPGPVCAALLLIGVLLFLACGTGSPRPTFPIATMTKLQSVFEMSAFTASTSRSSLVSSLRSSGPVPVPQPTSRIRGRSKAGSSR